MASMGLQTDELDSSRVEELGRSGYALAMQMLRNREDAADAVQDALFTLVKKRRLFNPRRGEVRPWFLKIVRNGCLDLIRKRGRHPTESSEQVEEATSQQASPSHQAEAQEEQALLRRELMSMPPEHRDVILLRDYHSLSYAEIASVLSVPTGTIMSRLHRARTELRNRMQRYWG